VFVCLLCVCVCGGPELWSAGWFCRCVLVVCVVVVCACLRLPVCVAVCVCVFFFFECVCGVCVLLFVYRAARRTLWGRPRPQHTGFVLWFVLCVVCVFCRVVVVFGSRCWVLCLCKLFSVCLWLFVGVLLF
jgi:hypothetical protein